MSVGIVGYGAYVPRFRITLDEIALGKNYDQQKAKTMLGVQEKAVPGYDEDAVTMGVEATRNALIRAAISSENIEAIFVGSESHPYAVKPSATLIAQACCLDKSYKSADLEFACKGGTAALQVAMSMVQAKMASYALAIGTDTAQANPKDILEFSAGAGSAAFVVGSDESEWLASLDYTCSLTTETPDFWRRGLQPYPEHAGRFTAEPAYMAHVEQIVNNLFNATNTQPHDFDYVIFHQPNAKMPVGIAKRLGFVREQYGLGLLAPMIGNAYSACSLLGLTAVLDQAVPGKKILLVSYGSGSGSDAFIMTTHNRLVQQQNSAVQTQQYIENKTMVSYATYRRYVETLQ